MAPLARSATLLVSLLAALAISATGQETYSLPKTHSFTVGDVEIYHRSFGEKYSAFRLPARTLNYSFFGNSTEHRRTEVLEVDQKGQPVLIRLHIVLSKKWTTCTTPPEDRGTWRTELRDVRFLARREGIFYRPDPSTVTIPAGTKLTQPQIDHLREYLDNLRTMVSFRRNYALLLPLHPVRLQESWKPDEATLKEYIRRDPELQEAGTKLTSAELKLLRVTSGVATVADRMRMTYTTKGVRCSDDFEGEADLDLKTGLSSRVSRKVKITGMAEDHKSMMWTEAKATTELVSGNGTASELPAGLERFELPKPTSEPSVPSLSRKPVVMDDLSRKTLMAYVEKVYCLGDAEITKASYRLKVTADSDPGPIEASADYRWNGTGGSLKWDSARAGAKLSGIVTCERMDADFRKDAIFNDLAGGRLTATGRKDGEVAVAVAGETARGLRSYLFGENGLIKEQRLTVDVGAGGTREITMRPRYRQEGDVWLKIGGTAIIDAGTGTTTQETLITWQKVQAFWVVKKMTVENKQGGITTGKLTFEHTDWKLNDQVQ